MTDVRPAPVITAPEISAPEPSAEDRRRDNLVIWVLLVAAFTVILNETVMGVAIPHLMTDLNITAVSAQWLTTAFLLTMSVVIPITGYLLQRFPTRAVFLTAMSLFSAGTLLAALSTGFPMLLMARVVQASGTAIMIPLLMTTVMTLVPAAERGRRMGNITIVIALAPALGPTISGTILNFAGWRFLFWFVLPVALAALIFGAVRITNVGKRTAGALDLWSVPLVALGFGDVVFGLSKFGDDPATRDNRLMYATLGVGAVALGAFVWRQLVMQRTDRALLDLRTFRSRVFTLSIILFVIAMAALFGSIILLPLFAQGVLGLSVLQTGLLLLPGGLVFGLMGPVVGRWYDRVGPRPLVVPGAALIAISMWAIVSFMSESTPVGALLAFHVVSARDSRCSSPRCSRPASGRCRRTCTRTGPRPSRPSSRCRARRAPRRSCRSCPPSRSRAWPTVRRRRQAWPEGSRWRSTPGGARYGGLCADVVGPRQAPA